MYISCAAVPRATLWNTTTGGSCKRGPAQVRATERSWAGVKLRNPVLHRLQPQKRTRLASGGDDESLSDTEESKQVPKEETVAKEVDAETASAQRTAIITGVFSIAIAFGYLALAQLLGNRELLPPPPEAMGL